MESNEKDIKIGSRWADRELREYTQFHIWTVTGIIPSDEMPVKGEDGAESSVEMFLKHYSLIEEPKTQAPTEGWRTKENDSLNIYDVEDFFVCSTISTATTHQIVREHNSHHELLEALKELKGLIYEVINGRVSGYQLSLKYNDIDNLINKAEGGKND